MNYVGIVISIPFFLLLRVALLIDQRGVVWSREGLLFWPQMIKHFIALFVNDPKVMVGSHWPQWCYRLQVRISVQPLIVMRPWCSCSWGTLGLEVTRIRLLLLVLRPVTTR